MLITIDTEEALKFSLSIQDLAVLDVIRRLLAADGGAVETNGTRQYKWLSNSTILRHLQCSSFRSPRQLHNIINKLCSVGLLIKKMWYGKPYYSAILRTKKSTATRRAPHVAAAPSAPMAAPSAAVPAAPAVASAAAPAVAPSIPGTSAAPTVAPPVPRRVDAPTVAAAPVVPSLPSALHADHAAAAEPDPEELRAALASIDEKTAENDRRAAQYAKQQTAKYRKTIAALIPTAEDIKTLANTNKWQDFDIDGFITFNTERNWSALRRRTWRQLAAQWYDQQCKKLSELITYDQYCIIAGKDHAAAKLWTFHHIDQKTGVSYFSRVQSAAIVGGASTQSTQKAAPLDYAPQAKGDGNNKRYLDTLEKQPKAAPGNNPQR